MTKPKFKPAPDAYAGIKVPATALVVRGFKPKQRNVPPADLSASSAALWTRTVAEFAVEDSASLALLHCALGARDRMLGASEILRAEGVLQAIPGGLSKAHPCVKVENDARAQFVLTMKALRLTVVPTGAQGRPPSLPLPWPRS